MAIRKINYIYVETDTNDIEELCKKFPKGFRQIFLSSARPRNQEEAKQLYTSNEAAEQELLSPFFANANSYNIMLGYPACGKTTILNHCLGPLSNEILLLDKTLTFPNFFQGYLSLDYKHYTVDKAVAAVNEKIEESYPKLSEYFYSEQGTTDFFFFFYSLQPAALQYSERTEISCISLADERAMRLAAAKDYAPSLYEAIKLQFLLTSAICPIEQLNICVDGVDTLEYSYQKKIITSFLRLYDRLTTFPKDARKKYYTTRLLISLRPESYHQLCKEQEFSHHPVDHFLKMNHTINLENCLSKRIKNYFGKHYSKNLDIWRSCLQQFGYISQRFCGKYDNMIKSLSFYHVQDSLLLYAKILCNQRWVRKDPPPEPQNFFHPDNYIINNITVIRAIACGENEMFVNSPDNFITNLLYNEPQKNYSIMCLYILRLFTKYIIAEQPYGSDILTKVKILQLLKEIFPSYYALEEEVETVLNYFFAHKILLYSITNKVSAGSSKAADTTALYLTPKGRALWNMLQSDSVLMELYREDYYREYDTPGCYNNPLSSYILMRDHQQDQIFIDLCRILCELINLEEQYLQNARKHHTMYAFKQTLGSKMVCVHLMSGIEKSMDYSGLKRQAEVNEEYQKVMEKLYPL